MPEKPTNPPAPPAPTPDEDDQPVVPRRRECGTMPVHRRLLSTSLAYVRARASSENRHAEFKRSRAMGAAQQRTGVTRIPVVVHVVHHTAAQNVSDAQIKSQIDVLNKDFRKTNADIASVPGVFQAVVADARIEFALATTDPSGNPTSGVTRTQTANTSFTDDDGIKSTATGGANAWPADKYLNIWTAPRLTSPQGDLLGYAQFPGGPAATDGVVILHSAFGTVGSAAAPFNLGRTTTHEVGHWLNLRHIWGDDGSGCNGSDFVTDTPNQAGPNFGAPAFPKASCNNGPNGDMFMNYMDYVDDAAMFMFTVGQVERMQACLDGDRPSIGTTVPVPGTGATSPAADIPGTLKFVEDQPTPTLKFRDDPLPTLKFRDDPPPTLKFRDDLPTLKFRDDVPTLKFLDDGGGGGTLKFIDDVKQPGHDKPPVLDQPKTPVTDTVGAIPVTGPFGGMRAAPFVLSTPHHSGAWTQSFPQAAQHAASAYEQQIRQYEEFLEACGQADAAGQVLPEERQRIDGVYEEYQALVAEYRQLFGGQ
jgi:hypothetical protein